MAESPQHRPGRASQIAQGYRTANEIVSGAMSLALCAGLGYAADVKLGWSPVLTICGACLGFAMAGLSLRRLILRLDREAAIAKQQSAEKKETSPE